MQTHSTTLLRIALPVPLRRLFDYIPPLGCDISRLKPGSRIRVPFQSRELVGVFIEQISAATTPTNKLKHAIEVIDEHAILSEDMLQLCQWAADYYHYPIGEVIACALPTHLRQGKPATYQPTKKPLHQHHEYFTPLHLNPDQQIALDAIRTGAGAFHVYLLNGITGSGKTEVYLQAISTALNNNKQVLVLVPEIGLTPQTIQRFEQRFTVPIVALHSRLTEKKRLLAWLAIQSNEAKIVIGTRSSVFSPFAELGLIVIDEEHDLSFKQQEGFRYHARDVAIMRAHFAQIPVVLGSATPSLESFYNAERHRYQHLYLTKRAGTAQLPEFKLIDIRNMPLDQGLSQPLLTATQQHLSAGNQVMLFLNRRGFAPVLMCHSCGWMALCKRCDTRMTFHQSPPYLHCHHCDTRKPLPTHCDACHEKNLTTIGLGTERLETVLQAHFPKIAIARMDRDTTQRKGKMEEILEDIHSGQCQILIGTQMLAKGHHFPNVTLVAIIDADSGFFSSDFRALERMGQLILQVAGRAGRDNKPGTVIIQTHHPDHPLLHQLLHENYNAFAKTLLEERALALLPPFQFFALFRADAFNTEHANTFLQDVKNLALATQPDVQLLGPITAPMPKRAGRHRMQLLLQATSRPHLQKFLTDLIPEIEKIPGKQRVRWSLDVDPLEMF